jgi:tetratricopeptide (TPR) repeat protein
MKNVFSSLLLMLALSATNSSSAHAASGPNKVQIMRAKNLMKSGDYYAALRLIREIEKEDSTSADVLFLSAECNFLLKNYADAERRLESAIQVSPNDDVQKYFMLGRVKQIGGKLNDAISNYEQFLKLELKKSDATTEAANYIEQCKAAASMLNNPRKVQLKNVGEAINSEYPDYSASVSADGQTLIFTSRRPESTGKLQDPDDGKFFEDIYISRKDSLSGKWLAAEPVEGNLNTEGHDANMSISADGKQIFVYRNVGYTKSGEIFVSKLGRTGKWSAAKPVEGDVNTSYFESSACVSPDGKTMYFVSEREKGGFGMGDIFMSRREGKNEWGKAVNLGPIINDEYDQIGVFIHPDGKTLYFASNSPKAIGGYDIFKTSFENGMWTKPENLGSPINTLGDERFFCMSTDGKTAWLSSDREGSAGELDIWEIDFSEVKKESQTQIEAQSEPIVPKGPALSIISGKIIDSFAGEIVEAEISIAERESGKTIAIQADENGQYFSTLEGDKNYILQITKDGFEPYKFEFFLKSKDEGTFTLEKLIVLEKKK